MTARIEDGGPAVALRVWWCPQVPMEPFLLDVQSIEEGVRLCDTLGKYDAFQFENNIKPDYCNAGGLQWNHPEFTDGEWWDFEEEDFDEIRARQMDLTVGRANNG